MKINHMTPEKWLCLAKDAGIPFQICNFLAPFVKDARSRKHRNVLRAQRFIDYYLSHPEDNSVSRHWLRLTNVSRGVDSGRLEYQSSTQERDNIVDLFISFPDTPDLQPYSLIFGRRTAEPQQERERYLKYVDCISAIQELLSPQRIPNLYKGLLSDASATDDEANRAAVEFQKVVTSTKDGLRKLKLLLEITDPAAKYLSSHHGESGKTASYIAQLARLNKYLTEPRHSAIAALANINCPTHHVTVGAIRNSWNRMKAHKQRQK